MNREYNINLSGLLSSLGLGKLIREPLPITGGHLHHMFDAQTESGHYAIKAINPQVIARPDARQNYINSEDIARIASKYIPALPANVYGNTALQDFEEQTYLIYNYLDGETLTPERLTPSHCKEIGRLLATLHLIDFSELGLYDDYSYIEQPFDFGEYLRLGRGASAVWVDRLGLLEDKLYSWQSRFIAASAKLADGTVISHGDFEPKNVMWVSGSPVVIDWEAAGFIYPAFDLVQNALYWARENDSYNEEKFKAFYGAYATAPHRISLTETDWNTIADKCIPMLGWLDYSLRRSLGIEAADEAERRMGTDHVFYTLSLLEDYERFTPRLLELIAESVK